MGKHTPGPWHEDHRKNASGMYSTEIYSEEHGVIATVWTPRPSIGGVTGTYRQENARLIAAAPDLLEALQAVLQWVDDNCETTGFDAVEAMADAALARAGAELFND